MENLKTLLASLKDKSFEELKNNCEFDIKEDGNLYMLSYKESNDLSDEVVREVNGVILEKDTNNLVHYAFSKTYDGILAHKPKEEGDYYGGHIEEGYRLELFIEGSLIRVFYYDGQWRIGTSRNIDAVYSYWGSDKSFKELFVETCKGQVPPIDLDLLNKECCYSFILQHPEVVLGYDITVPVVIPLNVINLSTLEVYSFMEGFVTDKSLENLELSLGNNYILITKDNKRIKLLSDDYKNLKKVLNNNSSIKWSYLKSVQDMNEDELRTLFPSKKHLFDEIDSKIDKTVNSLYEMYVSRFIKREECEVPKKFYKTLGQLHGRYKKTREKTNRDIIYNHILNLKTKTLYWILDF